MFTYDLVTVPDVFSLRGRRPDAAVVSVLLGRDPRSVRALVPDLRVVDWRFHDVTIVDMEDVSAPAISDDDLSLLRRQWPTSIMESLTWMQSELDCMRTKSKRRYKSTPATGSSFCGKWINNDMHRHLAMFHLELGQLCCCPVSWCTVWKGTPQDCMDHLRGSHAVSSEVKISMDVFLFTIIGCSVSPCARTSSLGCRCLFLRLLLWTVVGSTAIQNFLLQLRLVRDLRGASDSVTRGLSLPYVSPGAPDSGSRYDGRGVVALAVSDQAPGAIIYDCRPPILLSLFGCGVSGALV